MAAVVAMLALGCGMAFAAPDEGASQEADSSLSALPPSDPGVELRGKRTATSETFRLPDGSLRTRIFEAPINYRDAEGDWKPIGNHLEEAQNGGLTNGPNGFDVHLPERLGTEPVRLSVDGEWVSAELVGPATETAQLEGGVASYGSTDGGTSFEFSSLANGLKEDIEIASPSEASPLHFDLDASSGLTPVLANDGSIEFRDRSEEPVAMLPAPVMFDSSPGQPKMSTDIRYELEPQDEGGWRLALSADGEWLERSDLTWPVRLDPTLKIESPSLDCTIGGTAGSNGWGLCGSGGQKELYARYRRVGSSDEWSRSLLKFDLSGLPGIGSKPYVSSATLGVHAPSAAIGTSGLEVRRVSKAWTNAANWHYASKGVLPVAWAAEGGDYTSEGGQILTKDRGSQAGWWNFDVTALAQRWAYDPSVLPGFKLNNNGAILKLLDDKSGGCCSERAVAFDSSAAVQTSHRPYLEVTYYTPAPSDSKVVSPTEGTETARRLKLKAHWNVAGVTGVTFQFREGKGGVPFGAEQPFQTIPSSLIRSAKGEEVKWPMATKGNHESEPLFFNAAHATAALRSHGGALQVRALFEGPQGVAGYSTPVKAIVDRFIGGTRDAVTSVGPGSVNLLTGNFTVSRTDVSIPGITAGLGFSRTHNSRAAGSEATGVLGPGWKPGVPVEEAGGEWRSVKEVVPSAAEQEEGLGPYALLTDQEGYEYAFEKTGENSYLTPPELSGWTLKRESSTDIALSDSLGNRTVFRNSEGGATYMPVLVSQAGSPTSSRMVYEAVGGKLRLTEVIAPSQVECSDSNSITTSGCRTLTFTYLTPAQWGGTSEKGDRLGKITYWGPKPELNGGRWEVASYSYSTEGRLIAEWDPRISPVLKETYTYTAGGQIATITPPGLEPWTLEYGSYDEEEANGRLIAVKRPSLVSSPSTAQTTIAYGVPISDTGSGAPYDMSGAAVAKWGQQDIPTDATAIFPPDEVPSNPPTAYSRATVYYMDAEGQAVNTATPSGAGTLAPSITTTESDEHGNVVRELTAQNRLRALAEESELKAIARSHELETKRSFNADGTEMQEEWGPEHEVRLETGSTKPARMHTTVQYDEGWPGTGLKPHLPTRRTTGASIVGEGVDADQRTTETKYDWNLRKPTETIVDPLGLKLRSVTVYNGYGQPTEIRQPAGPGGGDAHTTKIVYSNGLNCGIGSPNAWGLPCEVKPATQPGTAGQPELLVKRIAAYSPLGQPTEVIESPGGKETSTRKTIKTYDTAGRETASRTEGGGTTVPPTQTLYSSTTGLPTERRFTCEASCEGLDNQAVATTYDKLGRPTEYLDADGNTSTFTYDLLGRPVTTNDGKGTQTRTYDATSGLLTELADSAAGTFTASYDADGNLVERHLPDGLTATTTFDEAGTPTHLRYEKTTSCSLSCVWLDFDAEKSIYGQVLSQKNTLSSQEYSYDKAGRLRVVKDTNAGGECTTRSYSYDADTNREALVTRAPGVGGACDLNSEGTTQAYSYDAGDRLIGTGISYDNFGRITSLPGEYAGGSPLSSTYYSNDLVASQTQDGTTNTYQLDAILRQRQRTQSGKTSGTEIYHYADGSDSPAWIESGATWSRNVVGIGGELTAIQDSATGTSLQLTNLHGDVVATASLSLSVTGPTATFESDEFGNPKGTTRKYGWLGGKGRRTELASGVVQMGVRSYVPAMGRFTSTDPVPGGSANSYEYAAGDPVNNFDLTGEWFYSAACWHGAVGCQCQLELWLESYRRGRMKIRMRRRCNRAGGITKTGWVVRYDIGKTFDDGGGSFHKIETPLFVKVGGGAEGPDGGPCRNTDPCQNYVEIWGVFICAPNHEYQVTVDWGFSPNAGDGAGKVHHLQVQAQQYCRGPQLEL